MCLPVRSLSILFLASLATACSSTPSENRALTDPSPDQRYRTVNFGRTGDPTGQRLDRGVPESSSTNPRNDPDRNIPPSQ
jgi:hypothetical protein